MNARRPEPRRELTEQELGIFARWLARTYLEIERGHRDVRALQHVASTLLVRRLAHDLHTTPSLPAVTYTDLGGTALTRSSPTHVYITVAVRSLDDTWDALLVELRQHGGGWHVIELGRLKDRCPAAQKIPAPRSAASPPTASSVTASGATR